MRCRACGKEYSDGAHFCPYCGTAATVEQVPDGKQRRARTWGVAILAAVVVVLAGVGLGFALMAPRNAPTGEPRTSSHEGSTGVNSGGNGGAHPGTSSGSSAGEPIGMGVSGEDEEDDMRKGELDVITRWLSDILDSADGFEGGSPVLYDEHSSSCYQTFAVGDFDGDGHLNLFLQYHIHQEYESDADCCEVYNFDADAEELVLTNRVFAPAAVEDVYFYRTGAIELEQSKYDQINVFMGATESFNTRFGVSSGSCLALGEDSIGYFVGQMSVHDVARYPQPSDLVSELYRDLARGALVIAVLPFAHVTVESLSLDQVPQSVDPLPLSTTISLSSVGEPEGNTEEGLAESSDVIDVSEGREITLSGVVFRKINRDDSAIQEVFGMIRLDQPVTFVGFDEGVGYTSYTTDEVKVSGAVNYSSTDGGPMPIEELTNDEWEQRLGDRVTCAGEIVGAISPHWDYVNFRDERVVE